MNFSQGVGQLVDGPGAGVRRQLGQLRLDGLPGVLHGAPGQQQAVIGVAGVQLDLFRCGGGSFGGFQLAAQRGGQFIGQGVGTAVDLILVHSGGHRLRFGGFGFPLVFVGTHPGGIGNLAGTGQLLFRFLCPLFGFGGAAQGGIFVFVGSAVAFLGTGGGGLQLAVLLMQAVNIGQGGIAGGFGGGCGIEGVHPVGAQLLVFLSANPGIACGW